MKLPSLIVVTAAALAAALAAAGCIPIPMALTDPEPFPRDALAAVQVGTTTRAEVRALFERWTYETDEGMWSVKLAPDASEDGRFWSFGLPWESGDVAFLFCIPYAISFACDIAGRNESSVAHWAVFEFAADTVVRYSRIDEGSPCAPDRICHRVGHLLLVGHPRTAAEDRIAWGCPVYVFGEGDFRTPLDVSSGATEARLFAEATFVRLDVASGRSDLAATTVLAMRKGAGAAVSEEHRLAAVVASTAVQCTAGEPHFVAARARRDALTLEEVGARDGDRALASRYPIGRAWPVPMPTGASATRY
jgi:hypothetical protein